MLQQELQSHQWKAFRRHPMFERNMGVKIFMFITFGILGLQLLSLGFFFDKILLEVGEYTHAIDTFNTFLLPFFLFDFMMKYTMKQNNSMQIAPYLTLPIKRNKLFSFLLIKEFTNIWNLYPLFLLIPFAFKAITPFWGFGSALLYIFFFYLLCVANGLWVNIVNNLQKRSGWFYYIPYLVVVGLFVVTMKLWTPISEFTVKIGEWVLDKNPFIWIAPAAILFILWKGNQLFMRNEIYRELQGKKVKDATTFSSISFLDKLGEKGEFIQMEIKMMTRSKRLKQQLYMILFFFVFYLFSLYSSPEAFQGNYFSKVFFTVFLVGFLGLIMAQYMFTAESSFFDGLMARKHSILNMMKGKYILYSSFSLLMTLILMVPVFMGKIQFFFLISVFFYAIGFLYFLMFQNAVYNKSYFDLFDGGAMNWKGTSNNMLMVTLIGMFLPIIAAVIIASIFNEMIANYFMFSIGLIFTITTKSWLKWTYNRFLQRKHKNMEGFRSNA
ncbi:DUF5687 family protein [Parabacteroides sp. OttesenSCG-928-K15]|nr:DUF5687 family protein [Parabacteroides sp. OttesenSCG-928-K15]